MNIWDVLRRIAAFVPCSADRPGLLGAVSDYPCVVYQSLGRRPRLNVQVNSSLKNTKRTTRSESIAWPHTSSSTSAVLGRARLHDVDLGALCSMPESLKILHILYSLSGAHGRIVVFLSAHINAVIARSASELYELREIGVEVALISTSFHNCGGGPSEIKPIPLVSPLFLLLPSFIKSAISLGPRLLHRTVTRRLVSAHDPMLAVKHCR